MEIKNTPQKLIDPYKTTQQQAVSKEQPQRSKQAEAVQVSQGDRVTLSPEAKLRIEALNVALNAPEIRQEAVDKLKAQVANGTYTADPRVIAQKMVAEDVQLAATLKE